MTDTDIRFRPAAGPPYQVVLASLPLFVLLVYFLVVVVIRASNPPYSDYGEWPEEPIIALGDMVIVFMVLCLMWSLLAVYLSFFIPKRHALVMHYLEHGRTVVGDVYYKDDRGCTEFHHYGRAIYPHPAYDDKPLLVDRKVRVFQRFTRELTGILVLPDKPFSGQPREDLETDRATFQRNEGKLSFLSTFSWIWVVFTLISPLYILYVMGLPDENIRYEDPNWMFFLVAVLVIPILAFGINWLSWRRYFNFFTKADARVIVKKAGDDGDSWFEDKDCEMVNYQPPKLETNK